MGIKISSNFDSFVSNKFNVLKTKSELLTVVKCKNNLMGTHLFSILEFLCKFFDFQNEDKILKNSDQIPDFYSYFGLKNPLPFSRVNRVKTVSKQFRKGIFGGSWNVELITFILRRLTHFNEIFLMGQVGLIFALVNLNCSTDSLTKVFEFMNDKEMMQVTKASLRFLGNFSTSVNFFIPGSVLVISKKKLMPFLEDSEFRKFLKERAMEIGYREEFLDSFFEFKEKEEEKKVMFNNGK